MSAEKKELDVADPSKPQDTDFRQQRLRAWQPLLTPNYVTSTFLITGIIFLIIGIVIVVTSGNVVEVEAEYKLGDTEVVLTIPKKMEKPVFLYYKLTNFYQNHRRYVKSRSDTQLAGKGGSLSTCDPLETHDDGTGAKTLYPCGLVASSVFRDHFKARLEPSSGTNEQLSLDSSNIAWKTDQKTKFKELYPSGALPGDLTRIGPFGEIPKVNDPHLIVWMRSAGLPTFKKLYAKIDKTLEKGDKVVVELSTNTYETASYGGTKAVVLSTASWLGGKNNFLGLAYIIVGGACILLAIAFRIKSPRDLGAIAYFNAKSKV